MLQFAFEPTKSTLKCIFTGRMDTTKSIEAEKEISTKLQTVTQLTPIDQLHIVFDLGDVDYIASAFIRICLQTAKTTSGKFSVQKTNPFVMKIFMMTGLDKELNVS